MFAPHGLSLERGWPGRIEGDRVIQLAAQTLQSFFTGGGSAREHAEYPLGEVVLLAPELGLVRLVDLLVAELEEHEVEAVAVRDGPVPVHDDLHASSASGWTV